MFFIVAATGTAPLSYQWQRAGTNLPNATTSTLSLLNLQTNDASNYRVVLKMLVGPSPARWRVYPFFSPSILTQPTNKTVIRERRSPSTLQRRGLHHSLINGISTTPTKSAPTGRLLGQLTHNQLTRAPIAWSFLTWRGW